MDTKRIVPCDGTRRTRSLRRTAICLFLLAVAGCSESDSRTLGRRTVQLDEVPSALMELAKKDLPDVTFHDAWKNVDKDGNLHSYEIRGRTDNGKTREIRIAPDGKILERE